MIISKEILQFSCLNSLLPQQKLQPRLHNNVPSLPKSNAGLLSLTIPQ